MNDRSEKSHSRRMDDERLQFLGGEARVGAVFGDEGHVAVRTAVPIQHQIAGARHGHQVAHARQDEIQIRPPCEGARIVDAIRADVSFPMTRR